MIIFHQTGSPNVCFHFLIYCQIKQSPCALQCLSISTIWYSTYGGVCKLLCCIIVIFPLKSNKFCDAPLCSLDLLSTEPALRTFSNISCYTFLIASRLWGLLLEAPWRACLRVSGTKWLTTAESCQAIVMLKQPLHSLHCSTSTEPGLEIYRLGAHDFPKASWSSDNSSVLL